MDPNTHTRVQTGSSSSSIIDRLTTARPFPWKNFVHLVKVKHLNHGCIILVHSVLTHLRHSKSFLFFFFSSRDKNKKGEIKTINKTNISHSKPIIRSLGGEPFLVFTKLHFCFWSQNICIVNMNNEGRSWSTCLLAFLNNLIVQNIENGAWKASSRVY